MSNQRSILPAFHALLRLICLAALLVHAPALAQKTAPWAPPVPGPSKKDWIQLPSGEWLAGEIEFLRNEEMEFDSDELELLTFDWADIRVLRSSRTLTYAFTGKRVAVGTATMQDSVVRVLENGTTREFRRRDLLSIVEGGGKEIDYWSGKLSFGLITRSGNTDQTDANSIGSLRRDGTITRFDLRYEGNVGELEGTESINNHLAGAKFDVFLSRLLFVTPLAVQVQADRFQNLDHRTTVALSLGYYLARRSGLECFVAGGGGYLSTRYRSVEPGEDIETNSGALIPAFSLEWDPVTDLTIELKYNATMEVPDVENWVHHLVGVLTLENLRIVDLDTSITWDRVAKPVPRSDGSIPDSDDLRTTFGIGIDF
jgi:hypothetical protein